MGPKNASEIFSTENDEPYLLLRDGFVSLRTSHIGPVRQAVSSAFIGVLAEFKRLVQARIGDECRILFDTSSALGRREGNASKPQRLLLSSPRGRPRTAVVIYLRQAPNPGFDEYVVAHELVHNILYIEGLPRLECRQPDADVAARKMLSAMSTATSHFLVNPRMASHGYDVASRESQRLESFRTFIEKARPSPAYVFTCADFFYHAPAEAAAVVPNIVAGFGAEAQARFVVVRRIIENARLPELRNIEALKAARESLLAEFSLSEIAASVDPFETLPG